MSSVRPSYIPQTRWKKMSPRQRLNIHIGLMKWDSKTDKVQRINLRDTRKSSVKTKVVTKKRLSTKKTTTKKIRRVDWLKSMTTNPSTMVSGNGSFVFSDGSKYTGEFTNGLFHGHGIRVWEDGTIYSGDWKKGIIEGHGRIIYPSGVEYIGFWEKGVQSGRGTLFRKNGSLFVGEWKDGLVTKSVEPVQPVRTVIKTVYKTVEKKQVINPKKIVKTRTVGDRQLSKKEINYEKIDVLKEGLGLSDNTVERLKRSMSILTLRDLTHYEPSEVVRGVGMTPSQTKRFSNIRKFLKQYGLTMKSITESKPVDVTNLSLKERRRLRNERTQKERTRLDKLGSYYSNKYW